jgi:transposase-like protein
MARAKPWKAGGDKSAIVAAIPAACSDELLAVEFMERQRWGDSPACPRCGDTDVYTVTDRKTGKRSARFLWDCRGCRRQFTVRIGTILEDSRVPLRHWCYAFWAACASKKGVSALQIKRQTGLSYKSALFLMHRIRWAMAENPDGPLSGTVEVDETYVGGRPRAKEIRQAGDGWQVFKRGRARDFGERKTPVVALVERGGRVRAIVPRHVTAKNLRQVIEAHVAPSAHLMTDELNPYRKIGRAFARHDTVTHSRHEYVRGLVSTNTVEGFFSLLKRGLMGTFHHVSRKHLHRYVSEFEFRYNTRRMDDGERTVRAIRAAQGKRLMVGYRDGLKKAAES